MFLRSHRNDPRGACLPEYSVEEPPVGSGRLFVCASIIAENPPSQGTGVIRHSREIGCASVGGLAAARKGQPPVLVSTLQVLRGIRRPPGAK
jgi:hypothetical protein